MSLMLCILASGSSGNCMFVGDGAEGMLIDAGLSCRETERRLAQIGAGLEAVKAICLTHEHSDHIAGLRALHGRSKAPLYANSGTIDAIRAAPEMRGLGWNVFSTGSAFNVGGMLVEPFAVPHDACEPVGFAITAGEAKAAVVTDIGTGTRLVVERLRDCRAIALEANHDEGMLEAADRPWALKQRIAGRQGHLSNSAAARLLLEAASPQLETVFLCHLSQDCNRPELAVATVRNAFVARGLGSVRVQAAAPDRVCEVWRHNPAETPSGETEKSCCNNA